MVDMETKSNKLNRELLRWIQSLDLAYSIKNVKRDFANGFLVAEILSRYYEKDISMHSYDNGIGMKVKKDNWDQLTKLFTRIADLDPLTNKNDIDAIVHCQNGAAVTFLTKLYQCLTKRTIQPTVVSQPPASTTTNVAKGLDVVEEIPPYAKPTNSAFIREKMREPEIAEMRDQVQINRKVRDIHSQHEETQHMERLMTDTPDRYPVLRSASKATVLRGATKPVRNDDSNPVLMTQQIVREVQIKTINQKGLEKLRATREAKENEALVLAHIQAIKHLREALTDDIPLFIHMLTILIAFLRVVPTQRMQNEEDDEAADVGEPTRDFTDQVELCLTIIEREFHPEASLNLRRVGLSYIAKNLEYYQELVPLYVDVLFSIPAAVRLGMLSTPDMQDTTTHTDPEFEEDKHNGGLLRSRSPTGIEHQLPVRGASGATYELLSLVLNWDSVAIAKQIFYEYKGHSSTDPEALVVMLKCFEQLLRAGQQLNLRILYDQMKGYVVMGLTNIDSCELSANILKVVLAALEGTETDLFQHVALVETLQTLVMRNVEDIRQQTIVKLLHDAHCIGPVWAERVLRCVSNLRSMCDPNTFKASLFSITFDTDS
ncbi:hypothetical protein BBJ29_004707 [Phytophthora kernoviae]|uniref:Spermatogenesis-associated protein 4 n=1 Tax=Phytophthora kernoviae TaxID=325452 RepID=A0A3F2RQU7_9STRA|nr:hypothetical protein BBP00_00004767 [Phytophthora kernoviae]RLN68573.1 hypothetical protein BBJ29_004707 [Phytophthora kernoviae]